MEEVRLKPFSWAVEDGHDTSVKALLEKCANIEPHSVHGLTPLSWAAEKGHETVVKLLLKTGADIEAESKYSLKPLSWAARNGQEVVVKLLLDKGANVEAVGNDDRTPLLLAAESGHDSVTMLQCPLPAACDSVVRPVLSSVLTLDLSISSRTMASSPIRAASDKRRQTIFIILKVAINSIQSTAEGMLN